jgi:alanyl-tRNA synthetase
MTLRLDRADAFQRAFEARVIAQRMHNGRPALLLDQSAFYPSAGGQPHDTGHIHSASDSSDSTAVIEVVEAGGEVLHVLSMTLRTQPERVIGTLDWARRFDHMQQHSGQHLLSQAFVRVCNLDTIAVHIGAESCTLDLPAASLPAGTLERAEDEANRQIYDNLPIRIYEMDDADLARIPLRKAPKVSGQVRIVEIEGYDWSACGGTHVRNLGQLGLIKIVRAEKRGAETRITFLCGRRALLDYRQTLSDVSTLAESFAVARHTLPESVQRLRDDFKAQGKALVDAQMRLLVFEANVLLTATHPDADNRRIIRQVWPAGERDMNGLRAMAKQLCEQPGVVALLGCAGDRVQLCFARAADVPLDMNALLRQALTTLPNGKGGGTSALAQGGGGLCDLDTLRAIVTELAHS